MPELPERSCLYCGGRFKPRTRVHNFCKSICGTRHTNSKRAPVARLSLPVDGDRVCERCSGLFNPWRRDQRVCTEECKKTPLKESIRGRLRKPAPSGMVACSNCDFVGFATDWKTRKYTHKGVTRSVFESWCEGCRKAARRAEYWADPEEARTAAVRWVVENAAQANLSRRAYAARKKGAMSVPYTLVQLTARLSMFGFRCWMCGAPATTVDHVKPLIAGGYDCLSNLRPACKSCNCSKRGTWPFDIRLFQRVPRSAAAS